GGGAAPPGGPGPRGGRPRGKSPGRGRPAPLRARRSGGAGPPPAAAPRPADHGRGSRARRDACRGSSRVTVARDPLFDLSGRVAVVTGGLGQLGAEYVAALSERGMRVAVFDLAAVAGTAEGSVRAFRVDGTSRGAIEAATRDVISEWGVPDLLVNNAALDSPPDAPPEEVGPFETYPEGSFDRVMDVNVKGTLLCCQVIGAEMAKAR